MSCGRAARACAAGVCAAISLVGVPRSTSAGPGGAAPTGPGGAPVISLDMEGCSGDEPEVRRLLGIELEADVIGPASASPDVSTVRVTCERDVYELVVVSRTDPTKARRRELDLASTGAKARPRFVALAIVELITTRWPDPPSTPAAEPAVDLDAGLVAKPRPPARQMGVVALGVARAFPGAAGAPLSWGLALRVDAAPSAALSFTLDLAAELARIDAELGHVDARSMSLAPALSYRRWGARVGASVGAGVRLALAQIAGAGNVDGVAAQRFVAPWAGPMALAAVAVRLGRTTGWRLELGAEAGYALVSVEARTRPSPGQEGTVAASLAGPWAGVALGLGWGWRADAR